MFDTLGLTTTLIETTTTLGFEQPTPIQREAIPALLAGRDVIGQAQTGTGKTAAFVLPLLQNLQPGRGAPQALILAPTRELAIQVADAAGRMAAQSNARVLVVYGGQPYHVQVRQLQRGVDVVVGTPGRLIDLLRQNILDLSQVRYLVLDEADEMLEMGFIEDVETILQQIPAGRQTALFSATLPPAVRSLAERYLNNPQVITINAAQRTVAETEQRSCLVREEYKTEALARLLETEDVRSALIFARTKARAQDLADELTRRGYPAASLHGDLNQARREYVLNRFRDRTITLLVATDVAARGLDIEDVSHVFNYDMPGESEDYVHRIGRTGRAGRKGVSITFVAPKDRRRQALIEAFTRVRMTDQPIPNRAAIQARRDKTFLARLGDEMMQPGLERERSLLSAAFGDLASDPENLLAMAAAAVRLARAGEMPLPAEEISAPARLDRKVREERPGRERPERSSERSERKPARPANREYAPRAQQPAFEPRSFADREQEPGMVRLRMNLGNVHGVRPGDVVGAIASEVGIPGRAIGEINIQQDHTFVDVAEKHVRQVLRKSGGSYSLRGQRVTLTLAG